MLFDRYLFTISSSVKWVHTALTSYYNLRGKKPVHVLFCMVDHYEPGTGGVDVNIARERVNMLLSEYPRLADRHRDSDGCRPKRTWFFPPHYHRNYFLRDVVSLCKAGYGEIELHLHHGKYKPDTPDNLEVTVRRCIEEYSRFGIFGTQDGQKKYAFIHGDWALANSRNGKFCGVNSEIEILSKTGCYADFTLPTPHIECNPSQINSIYYAREFSQRPKSYDTGIPVKTLTKTRSGLMIIQGPLYPFFKNNTPFGFRIYGDVATLNPATNTRRIDTWIRTGISIRGKPEWIIIKVHSHGATDYKAVLGEEMDEILNYLEHKYNDGDQFVLHYVSTRELYNIIKAAEAGESGSGPDEYRNYIITAPLYDSSPDIAEASEQLKSLIAVTYRG